MKALKSSALALVALLLLSHLAIAGVTADVTIHNYSADKNGKKNEELAKGKYAREGTKVYVEHQVQLKPVKADPKDKKAPAPTKRREPAKQAFYLDQTTWKATKILNVQKRFMDIDLTQQRAWEQGFWSQFLTLGGIAVNAEDFKRRGIDVKQLKDEKMGGHLCTVWNLKRLSRGTEHDITIWEAKDLDNAPMKIVAKVDGEKKSEYLLSNAKKAPVDVALFSPPKDYTSYQPKIMVGSMPDVKKGGLKNGQAAKPRKL